MNSREGLLISAQMLLLACAIVAALFLWEGWCGFSLSDEGFLWYGAQRVMDGEVPIRDFMSYDPGRYYWSALLMKAWGGNGILALRGAIAAFQSLGLFVALLLVWQKRSRPGLALLALSIVSLAVWMFPRHKLFDISLSIALIGTLTFLVRQPSPLRFFLAGACVGFIAIFGRNHGVYGVAGTLGIALYLLCRGEDRARLLKGGAAWAVGVVVGYLPVLLMIALMPGFAAAFWEGIRFLFEVKTTDLPLPVPWPWSVPIAKLAPLTAIQDVLEGTFFVALLVFGVLGFGWSLLAGLRRKPVAPEFVASAALALPYAHFAFSRADVGHLAQGIFPFLIGTFVLLAYQPAIIKWAGSALLTASSLLVALPQHPGWACHIEQNCVKADVAGTALAIDRETAKDLLMLKNLVDRFSPRGRSFLVTPFWPGAYAVFERKSPMWEIYALFPRSESFQREEIDRIKKADPGFALIIDIPLDGRDQLRFRNTHSLIERYIRENFTRLPQDGFDPAYQLFEAKTPRR